MDDPWANAWGEPPKSPVQPTWTKPNVDDDQEADIGMPSWSTGAEVKWAEPSETHNSLWSQPTDPAQLWGSSSYENISIRSKTSPSRSSSPKVDDHDDDNEPVASPAVMYPETTTQESPSLPSSSPVQEAEVSLTVATPPSPLPPAGSPDPFGTFETGVQLEDGALKSGVDPWTPAVASFPAEEWGSAWKAPETEGSKSLEDDEAVDEWEAAKQRKETRDRVVPPELLASILRQCEELSKELWPDPPPDDPPDDWRRDWRSGMDGVPGLTDVASKYPREMTLPPPVPFGKTATMKHMSDALKLTRHAPLTRLSPMAVYLASKGSTAWETSVKNRPEVKDDLMPAGWRIVDKDKEREEEGVKNDIAKGKKGGGLLSFWGRRASSVEAKPERASSPTSAKSVATPRSSVDRPTSPPANKPVSPLVAVSSSSTSTPPRTSLSSSSAVPLASAPAAAPAAPAPGPDIPIVPVLSATPAPSAVSRFLNRFSRSTKSGQANARNSLALSSDDMDFLSEVVPSASDDDTDWGGGDQLQALSSMIGSDPVPEKLPPPLAPPPRAPAPLKNTSTVSSQVQPNTLEGLFSDPIATASTNTSTPPPKPAHKRAPSNLPPPLPIPISPSTILTPSPGYSSKTHAPLSALASPSTASSMTFPRSPVSPLSRTEMGRPSSAADIFTLPPPPSSRSHTPIAMPPPPQATRSSLPGVLPPPPSAPSRTHTPTPAAVPKSSSLFDDDDEFSDFHSSVPPSKPSHQPKLSSYDDFTEFHSMQPQSSQRHHKLSSYDSTFSSSTSSDRNLFPQSSKNAFDDFDEFVSSPLRSPSPPPLPTKTSLRESTVPSLSPPPAHKFTPPPPPEKTRHRKEPSVTAIDHMRTASLLDQAAARPGRWPAPPSPLPEALSPPPKPAMGGFDFFGDVMPQQHRNGGGTYAQSMINGGGGTGVRAVSPPLPPPPGFVPPLSTSQSLSLLAPSSPARSPPPNAFGLSATPSSTQGGRGGLSAQDLSFFEGL